MRKLRPTNNKDKMRTDPKALLNEPRRRAVYEDVMAHPNTFAADVARRINVPTSTLHFHIRVMLKGGLLRDVSYKPNARMKRLQAVPLHG